MLLLILTHSVSNTSDVPAFAKHARAKQTKNASTPATPLPWRIANNAHTLVSNTTHDDLGKQ
jgi:hypothetical protein